MGPMAQDVLRRELGPVKIVGTSEFDGGLEGPDVSKAVSAAGKNNISHPYLFPEYLDLVGLEVAVPVEGSLVGDHRQPASPAGIDVGRSWLIHGDGFLITGGFPELLIARQDMDDETSALAPIPADLAQRRDRAGDLQGHPPRQFGVDNPMLLERLLYTLAGQFTGRPLRRRGSARDLGGLSQPTFDRYLVLSRTGPFSFSPCRIIRGAKRPSRNGGRKLYFVDAAHQKRGPPAGNRTSERLRRRWACCSKTWVAGHLRALNEVKPGEASITGGTGTTRLTSSSIIPTKPHRLRNRDNRRPSSPGDQGIRGEVPEVPRSMLPRLARDPINSASRQPGRHRHDADRPIPARCRRPDGTGTYPTPHPTVEISSGLQAIANHTNSASTAGFETASGRPKSPRLGTPSRPRSPWPGAVLVTPWAGGLPECR